MSNVSPYLSNRPRDEREALMFFAKRQRDRAAALPAEAHVAKFKCLELARAYERAIVAIDQRRLALDAYSPLPPVTLQTCMRGPYVPGTWEAMGWPEDVPAAANDVSPRPADLEAQMTAALEAMRPIFEAAPSAGRDLPVVTLNAAE